MKTKKSYFLLQILMLLISSHTFCQQKKQSEIIVPNIGNTAWWSGVINHGHFMPLQNGYFADFTESNYGNQVQPMLISNNGQLIWSEQPFTISIKNDTLKVISETPSLKLSNPGTNLKEAFQYAVKNYFPPQGKLPDELLFSAPQYNTWVELMYIDGNRGGWQVFGNNGKTLAREKGTGSQKYHLQNFIDCIRNRDLPNRNIEQGHLSATIAHMGNISYRTGNKQLLFDSKKERFTNNEQANSLLKTEYREGYIVPDKI